MKEVGIYVHIPFCIRKCDYCDFVSFEKSSSKFNDYVNSVLWEIDNYKDNSFNVDTIYFGGGTPSVLDAEYIAKLLRKIRERFIVNQDAEITIEVNPGTVTKSKLERYYQIGINRLSIGLQSSSNVLLKNLGRIHTYDDFVKTFDLAREVGFKNINVDLMLGIPGQSIWSLKETLMQVIDKKPTHISMYSLILEDNTKLKYEVDNGIKTLPTEDEDRDMYWNAKRILEEHGFEHYEISNFAQPGYKSLHNWNCWNQKEYLGFGLASHGYMRGVRYSHTDKLIRYLANPVDITVEERQSEHEQKREFMLLGLRKIEGVCISDFERKFSINPLFYFRFEISKLVEEELIEVDLDHIRLTKRGLDLANQVWMEFV